MKLRKHIVWIAPLLLLVACKPKLDGDVELNAGELNLSRVVYAGDYLTSGYTNGGLYRTGQESSIPFILSTQFQIVGGGTVAQPLMPSGNGSGYWKMESYNTNGSFTRVWEEASPSGSAQVFDIFCYADTGSLNTYTSHSGSVTNYSFPMLKVGELSTAGMGNTSSNWFNPFFARVSPGDNSYINQISNESPTFFVCAFGLSDVMEKVKTGWSCGTVTDEITFKENYRKLLEALTATTSEGVLIEVPAIDQLPYLNANHTPEQTVYIEAKRNYVDDYEIREYEGDDQFFRSSIDKIGVDGYGLSDSLPIQSEDLIDRWEKFQIASDIDKYNQIINELAEEFNLPVVSMEDYLVSETGYLGDSVVFNGVNLQVDYNEGSAISLDGYSPTPRGGAVIANKCIQQINAFYNASIPLADINQYPGLDIP